MSVVSGRSGSTGAGLALEEALGNWGRGAPRSLRPERTTLLGERRGMSNLTARCLGNPSPAVVTGHERPAGICGRSVDGVWTECGKKGRPGTEKPGSVPGAAIADVSLTLLEIGWMPSCRLTGRPFLCPFVPKMGRAEGRTGTTEVPETRVSACFWACSCRHQGRCFP
jgi:hypothetical protein